jgi:hypothetical protein
MKIVMLPLHLYWCDVGVSDQSLVSCAFNVETQSQGTVASRQSQCGAAMAMYNE